jgi:oligopeptidase B
MTAPDLDPPAAPMRPHVVRSPHGDRTDPYYWLRDDERANPEVLAHLAAENAYRERVMAAEQPLETALYEEIIARLKPDESSVPYLEDGYWYWARFAPGQEHPIYVRRRDAADAPEEIVLDVNLLAAGKEYCEVGALAVSPDGRHLAFCEDTVGRRQFTLRFKDLATGELEPAAIPDVESSLAWANDNRTVLYVEKDPETLLGLYVKKHVLGQDPGSDALVFEQTDKSFYTDVSKSKSRRLIFISMESTVSSEWHYADADDPALAFKTVLAHAPDHEYQVEHLGNELIIRTNWSAYNFRIMSVPLGKESDRGCWRDLVAHQADIFIEDFDVFREFLALEVRSGGLAKIRIVMLDGSADLHIASDEAAYAAVLSVNREIDSPLVRYLHSALSTPTTIYDYDVRTGERILKKRDPILGPFDPADYRSEFLFAPASDGAPVPVSLVYRKEVERDGRAPLLQYAYGAYGSSIEPSFSSARLSLLDRGVVFAIAHVRGGQEMGRRWYDAGRKLHKRNTFSDFVDVTHHLIEQRYAAPDKVFAMGGSAGGLTVAAVANLSPRDYRGIVAQVPFVDVITTMLDEEIPLTTNEYEEWGDPRVREYYDYMLTYSPYDNVRARAYPSMFVTTGLWDSQVQYYEPVKWVAKLRAMKTGPHPIVMHVDLGAGHGGKAGRFERYREIAMEYAFILGRLGIRR